MRPGLLFVIAWVAWAVIWGVAAFWSNPTVKRAATVQAWVYRAMVAAGLVLLWPDWTTRVFDTSQIWSVGPAGAYTLAGLTFAGLLFAGWARWHMGRLWSGAITRKEGHHIVDTGPYAIVRHPIYTGIIAATLTTVLASATAAAFAGFMFVAIGFLAEGTRRRALPRGRVWRRALFGLSATRPYAGAVRVAPRLGTTSGRRSCNTPRWGATIFVSDINNFRRGPRCARASPSVT
jgi:protein-S-isoprenylcysteine O-methyltransferase Ste14